MALRALVALFLLLCLSWLIPFGVLAEDAPVPETEAPVQEPIVELAPPEIAPEPTIPEVPVSPVSEEPEPGLEDSVGMTSLEAPEVNEEPELIFDCEIQEDGEGNQTERCGFGYYRTLCGYSAGVEECVTFFEFQEDPGPPPILTDIEQLRSREYITLHLSWNGASLQTEEASVPFGVPGTLGWAYDVSLPEHHNLPYTYQGTYAEMLAAATLTLQIYKGPIGGASLIYSEEVVHGGSGEIPITFEDSDEYRVILSATFPYELNVPGYECGGELCPTFDPRIESLVWFMQNAAAYYDDITDEIDASRYFYEYGARKSRMATFVPLVSGMQEVVTSDAPQGISSVLFLPGIKGSRLYRPTDSCDPDLGLSCLGVKLWEPSGDLLLRDLFLTASGGSGRSDIYVKEGDIVSEVLGNNFYASFVNQMDALTSDGTLPAWKPIAYDWRLSLDDIVNKGVKRGEKVYYQEATDAPYIEKSLKELAASSPTGKVSIVAHSNGGLVAKRLMQRLEANGEAGLVDQIIFVGVPQSGAPQAMAALLYGFGEALPFDQCSQSLFRGWLCALLGSRDAARELAEHSPMAHHLLPSRAYFDQVENPVASFTAATAYLEERNRYGTGIDTVDELYDFLAAKDGGRVKPDIADMSSANVLNTGFLNYGRAAHESLDAWVPPSGVRVHQIAGWGMNTIAGVEFYEQKKLLGGYKEMYRPIFVEDGDRVVPVPSALLMSSEYADNYWIDLRGASRGSAPDRDHGSLFELASIRTFIRDLLVGTVTDLPEFVTKTQPNSASNERLIFFLHSPLTLELYDGDRKHAGESDEGDFDEEIQDVEYGEFGDVKYIIAPVGTYDVVLRGKDTGTFSIDVQEVHGNEVRSSITLADVPTTKSTVATLTVTGDLSGVGPLRVDKNGDGTTDLEMKPVENETIVFEPEPFVAIEQESNNSSRSTSTKQEGIIVASSSEYSANAFLFTPITSQKMHPAAEAGSSQEDETILTFEASGDTTTPTKEIFSKQTQTASVYDALGSNFLNWAGTMLYNFWDVLIKILTGLLHR